MDDAEQPAHPLKRFLIVVLVTAGLLVPIGSLLFTTAEVPPDLSPTSSSPNQIHKAVVSRWFFDSRLKPGDLVLVELRGTPREFALRKLQEIVPPDPSTRRIATRSRPPSTGSRPTGTPNRAAI